MASADGASTAAKDAAKPATTAAAAATTAIHRAVATNAALGPAPGADTGVKLSPAAKRVAEENKLDPKALAGAGTRRPGVEVGRGEFPRRQGHARPGRGGSRPPRPRHPRRSMRGGRADQRVPMTRLRARIAERMVQAQATQALLTSFNEVDLHAVNELRSRYKDSFEKQHGVKLGFMSFFTKACVEALKKFPAVNASVEGNDIVYHEYFDVGVAVSTDRGLIVPVLRDADQLSFADIEKSIGNFAARARAGSITMEELTGGTFTITNGGVFGSLLSTPIVNAPQSAILGMHKIQERPVAVDGQVVIRPMMYIALTYDHRIIDGREAVQFLVTVKQCLEDPARMVLGI